MITYEFVDKEKKLFIKADSSKKNADRLSALKEININLFC